MTAYCHLSIGILIARLPTSHGAAAEETRGRIWGRRSIRTIANAWVLLVEILR